MIETISAITESVSTIALASGTEGDAADVVFPEGSFWGELRNWTENLPDTLQWLGLMLIAAIPFVESFFAAFIGVIVGVPFWVTLLAAVIGNMLSLVIVIYGAHWVRSYVLKRKEPKELSEFQLKRRNKIKRVFDKFGIPGVSILGPLALPSQISAPLMVSLGANRNLVMIWMFVSVVLWGVGFALLGLGFLQLVSA